MNTIFFPTFCSLAADHLHSLQPTKPTQHSQTDRRLQRPDILAWLSVAGCYVSLGCWVGMCHSKMGNTILESGLSGPSGPLPGARVFRQLAARCRLHAADRALLAYVSASCASQ